MGYGTRRLVFEPARFLVRPKKHMKALAKWAASFDGVFPSHEDAQNENSMHWDWHPPVDRRLMDPPWATPERQGEALQHVLNAAALIRKARPDQFNHQRVYVSIPWPEAWSCEVGVFINTDYGESFETRTHRSQTWTPITEPEQSLAHRLGLNIPEGFEEAGYHERSEDDDPDAPDGLFIFEQEVWMYREPPQKALGVD